jgi:hypothetical protein
MMRLNPLLATVLLEIDPAARKHLNKNGTIDVILDKALYGCLESGKLWYDNISLTLLSLGYQVHKSDPCVFFKGYGDEQIIIGLYVDDLLISFSKKNEEIVNNDLQALEKKYGKLTLNKSNRHKYLGMIFLFNEQDCLINMMDYTENILTEFPVDGTSNVPAASYLFDIDEKSNKLSNQMKKNFHRCVAKLLFLTKRTRPDIMLAVSFLTTRVQEPDEDDLKKLKKVLMYLNGTKDLGIKLSPHGALIPKAFVDSSHAVHSNFKGQGGVVITIGKGPIYASTSKLPIMTKSSTESELLTAADKSAQLFWSREFLINLGYNVEAGVLFQDNTSTINLINNGKSNSQRSKHINVKYFYLKERIDLGELTVEHCPTKVMIADILTKPISGSLFIVLRDLLLNWTYSDTIIFFK